MKIKYKAYIPLRCKKVALGPGVGLAPQRHYFALGIPTCWYLKMLKFAFPPMQNIKFAFPPTQNPNASQWNIGCVGSLALGLCVGHVHFIFCVLISFALGSRHKQSFQWNMGSIQTHWESTIKNTKEFMIIHEALRVCRKIFAG